ncbi:hypothetical protein SLE2022_236030 [Rubroshorea leprosula]
MRVTAMRSELETRMKPNNRKTTMKPNNRKTTMKPVIAKMSMHSLMESYRNREREAAVPWMTNRREQVGLRSAASNSLSLMD